MQQPVVVFDSDAERMASTLSVVRQAALPYDATVSAAADEHEFKATMPLSRPCVVVIDSRAGVPGSDGIQLAKGIADSGLVVQSILVGVDERSLPRAGMVEHAALLPAEYDVPTMGAALSKAFLALDRLCEQPFLVHLRRCDRVIQPSKVRFVESNLRKICIHVGPEQIEVYCKLSEVLGQLPRRFIQCHKSFVVNLGFVQEFNREYLLLTTGERVPVSQKRRRSTRDAFIAYVGRAL